MKLALGLSSVGLERDQLIAIRDAKGVRVSCLDGALWVTQEKMAADVLLEPGQSLVIDWPSIRFSGGPTPCGCATGAPCADSASAPTRSASLSPWASGDSSTSASSISNVCFPRFRISVSGRLLPLS